PDLLMLKEAAAKHHRKIGVSFNKRYNLAYRDMKLAIESEGFGAPSAFIAKFIGGYRSNETDLLRVGCCHFFDLARYLIGELDEVYAYKYEKQPGQ
ncbi:gfo/Idh/MocA family oxidoreductase, partial [[Clostridium] symbiosum]|nr:gfo/Idh/MocA family oxidoreductase [[Clostridium] symbiosum]